MCNNKLKFTNSELVQHQIMVLISAFLNTGYTPKTLNRSIIIPIMKDKNIEKNLIRITSDQSRFQTCLHKY
jgi:hypothetical protein